MSDYERAAERIWDSPPHTTKEEIAAILREEFPPAPDVAALREAILSFCAKEQWAVKEWKDQPHIKSLFDLAAILREKFPTDSGSKLLQAIVDGSQLCLDEPKWRLPEEVCKMILQATGEEPNLVLVRQPAPAPDVTALREALEWYADVEHYKRGGSITNPGGKDFIAVMADYGGYARAALLRSEPKEESHE
ncbi:MAG: hypothetical protein WC481_07710 [Candidatus Omnitrophota bacterium]